MRSVETLDSAHIYNKPLERSGVIRDMDKLAQDINANCKMNAVPLDQNHFKTTFETHETSTFDKMADFEDLGSCLSRQAHRKPVFYLQETVLEEPDMCDTKINRIGNSNDNKPVPICYKHNFTRRSHFGDGAVEVLDIPLEISQSEDKQVRCNCYGCTSVKKNSVPQVDITRSMKTVGPDDVNVTCYANKGDSNCIEQTETGIIVITTNECVESKNRYGNMNLPDTLYLDRLDFCTNSRSSISTEYISLQPIVKIEIHDINDDHASKTSLIAQLSDTGTHALKHNTRSFDLSINSDLEDACSDGVFEEVVLDSDEENDSEVVGKENAPTGENGYIENNPKSIEKHIDSGKLLGFKINYGNKSGSDLEGQDNRSNCSSYTTMETELARTNTGSSGDGSNLYSEYFTAAEAATERVAELINDDFECKHLFCQMDVLRMYKDDLVWKEMARWIRYEEAVEEGGKRWSKPHVASLMMEALQDLQSMISTCPVILNSTCMSMIDIADEVAEAWVKNGDLSPAMKNKVCNVLTKPHKFQHYEKKKSKHGTSTNLPKFFHGESHVNKAFENGHDNNHLTVERAIPRIASFADSPSLALGEMNKSFLRKIPPNSEVVNLFVGEVPELDKICAAFVRLKEAGNIGDITEVDLNTRFVFIVLGPKSHLGHCAEMTRCMATLFTDELFRITAFRGETRADILAGIQEFSLHLTVLPPGVWNPTTRIEPPDELPSQDFRKAGNTTLNSSKSVVSMVDMENGGSDKGDGEGHGDPTLVRSGKLFGGLIADVKRKIPFYLSDYKDALHIQCVASFFFLFLATLTPNVTFGGLLGQATDQYMGTMECILAAAISGILFAVLSGQPLNILGSTGPMLVLEGILYRFCVDHEWDFMPFRVWVGFWTGFFILLIVMFDLSALVRYITRFTEESFACLIALIFIYEAFKKTIEINHDAPVHFNPPEEDPGCFCVVGSDTNVSDFNTTTLSPSLFTTTIVSFSNSTNGTFGNITNAPPTSEHLSYFARECLSRGGTLEGAGCSDHYVPDAFFFSIILFFATFFLATTLVHFRHSLFFPTFVRTNVSDFAVLISIIVMVAVDYSVGLPTPKLTVPEEFKPTKPGRPWFINPISDKNPWWLYILSALPALLATILIFMDQQITAVIVNRAENKLKKGSGYHLDLAVVGVLVIVHGLLGLPWYVAATVTALAHIMSLKKVSECTAPGEKPVFLGVREQRVTALLVAIFSGLAVLITSVLKFIPMPVLYGVFLFMGVAPLGGMQLIQRVLIMFMPAKYQPDHSFVMNVPIKRVHIFTAIQVLCLAVLWVVKSIKSISIAFPLMVLIICFVRKAMDWVFTQRELRWLDDILPATQVKPGEAETDSKDGVKITVDGADDDQDKDGMRPSRKSLQPRLSLTFDVKTDIDRIKAMTPEIITDRRKSLIMAVERKRSVASNEGDHIRKMSSPSPFGRKLSCEAYSPHFSVHPFGGSPVSHDEHNKLNRMLSLPDDIN